MDVEPLPIEDQLIHGRFRPYGQPPELGVRMSDRDTLCSFDGLSTQEIWDKMNCPRCRQVADERINKLGRERAPSRSRPT